MSFAQRIDDLAENLHDLAQDAIPVKAGIYHYVDEKLRNADHTSNAALVKDLQVLCAQLKEDAERVAGAAASTAYDYARYCIESRLDDYFDSDDEDDEEESAAEPTNSLEVLATREELLAAIVGLSNNAHGWLIEQRADKTQHRLEGIQKITQILLGRLQEESKQVCNCDFCVLERKYASS